MALPTEQQAQVAIQTAIENARNAGQLAIETKRTRLEAVRLSKEVLMENARSKPVDSRAVTAAEITAFADSIINYINN